MILSDGHHSVIFQSIVTIVSEKSFGNGDRAATRLTNDFVQSPRSHFGHLGQLDTSSVHFPYTVIQDYVVSE